MARGGSRRVVATVDDDEEEDDAVQEAQCCVCAQVNARVTVVCAACAKTYHLACHSPPLRRRPGADTTWECSQCTNEEKKDTAVVKKRRRDPAVGGDDLEKKVEKEETNRKTKTRRAAKLVKRIQEESEEEDGAGESDEPLVKEVKSRAGKKPTETKAKVKAKAPRKSVKVQEPELAFKRLSRAAARSKVNAKSKASVRHELGDDEEEDGASEKDDENDSDFSVSGSSDGADDDDTQLSATDDEFEPPVKLPSRKKPHQPRVKKAPARKQNKRAPRKNKTGSTTDDQTVSESPEGDVENAQGSSEEDEVYTGPSYRIEYAPNGRASCKSCEQKLPKGILRVGIRVKHSMFGITTYFKHLECTQICLNETSFKAENGESDTSKDTSNSNSPDEPIRGFGSLQPKDKTLVQEHMKKNAELGLLDERRELSEDQYTRKTRMPEKEPSPHLTAALLPYQREALAWMTAQEQSDYKGGILADEMGMGKTIQAISLILENPRDSSTKLPDDSNNVKSKGRSQKVAFKPLIRGGTLVVCPVVAVMQWKSEIERFVERNHLTIYVHHGAKRMDLVEKIASNDIVLTTYSIIENEVRKTLGWEKVPCKYCKKKYLPDKLILHNKYFCGPNAKKTALQDRQKTKKKGKKAAGEESDGSDDDLKKNVKSKVPAKKKRGKKQEESEDDEDDYVEETAKQKAMKGKSPMHQIHWTRIVLDEAHYIKDRRCNTARGVFELKSDYKWCLTGTPLQNRIGELFSLIRFLQIKFYAYYHCSKCECQMLDFNFPGGKCVLCPHPAMHHFSYFNKKIVIPIQSYGYVAEGKVAMLRLQNELLQHILLRRTKEGRADDISLPPKLIRVRRDRLDERENDFYQAIYTQSQAQFNTYVSSGTLLNNYAHIFDLLIRLRQAVDHPYLVIYSKSNPALQISVPTSVHNGPTFVRPVVEEKPLVSVVDEDDDNVLSDQSCVICHEDVEDPVEAKCGHVFCRECVKEFIESLPDGAAATCPDCDNPLTVDLSPPKIDDDEDEAIDPHKPVIHRAHVDLKRYSKHSILHRISDLDSFQTSTKIEALMQELEHMKQRDPSGKAIIFSQFVNMLDIIQHRLTIGGIKCVKLSGNMSMDLRDRTIRAFREDNSVTAFLISLKAGGVALNLTIASHIFLMDPWWNPAAENQAIDRTHRLGQFKPVQATRFIIAGTIEERILKLQQKKQLIFEGTVGASVSAICRLTEDDLRFLFSK